VALPNKVAQVVILRGKAQPLLQKAVAVERLTVSGPTAALEVVVDIIYKAVGLLTLALLMAAQDMQMLVELELMQT
jgi:hypothetical protein